MTPLDPTPMILLGAGLLCTILGIVAIDEYIETTNTPHPEESQARKNMLLRHSIVLFVIATIFWFFGLEKSPIATSYTDWVGILFIALFGNGGIYCATYYFKKMTNKKGL